MNRCTQLDDILHEQQKRLLAFTTARTLLNFKVKGQCHFFRQWTKVHQIIFVESGKVVVANAVFRLSIA